MFNTNILNDKHDKGSEVDYEKNNNFKIILHN